MDENEKSSTPVWGVLELFGHKVVAGKIAIEEVAGASMYRMDVPPTSDYPGFTRYYSPSAVYSLTYVSEEAGMVIAQRINDNPVAIYVPELADLVGLRKDNEKLNEVVGQMRTAMKSLRALQSSNGDSYYLEDGDKY